MKRTRLETGLLALGGLVVAAIIGGLFALVFILAFAVVEARDAAVENNLLIRALIMTPGLVIEEENESQSYPTEIRHDI